MCFWFFPVVQNKDEHQQHTDVENYCLSTYGSTAVKEAIKSKNVFKIFLYILVIILIRTVVPTQD